MIDNLRQLAIFAKTIDHGSFRKAAGELRLSPSVVSSQISQLEEALGVALIYRSTRKLRLTKEGEVMLVAAHRMLEVVEGEFLKLSSSASEPSGELEITAPSVLTLSPLMDAIAAFSKTYPRIHLSLDFSDARRDIIDDGFDIAIRMGKRKRRSAAMRKLFKAQRVLVASQEFLQKHDTPMLPTDLEKWDWITLKPAQHIPVVFSANNRDPIRIAPKTSVFTNDAQALYRLARAGAGLAIVPTFLAQDAFVSGDMIHVLPEWSLDPVEVFASWPENAPTNGLIRLFVDAISDADY